MCDVDVALRTYLEVPTLGAWAWGCLGKWEVGSKVEVEEKQAGIEALPHPTRQSSLPHRSSSSHDPNESASAKTREARLASTETGG